MDELPRIIPWPGDIHIHALAGPEWAPAPAVRARVEAMWDSALRTPGAAFVDGELFSLSAAAGAELRGPLVGRFVKYRYYHAQRHDPSLSAELRIRPLAVTGVITCRDGVVIGQRLASAGKDAGLWEIVPAGGIEPCCLLPDGRIDPRVQLEKEMREEIGLGAADIAAVEPLLAMVEGDVTDIVFRTTVARDRREIQAAFARLPAPEHAAIDVIEPASVRLHAPERRFSASARALLLALGGRQ